MFFGTYTPKLDDKGRLTLPAKFRDDLLGGVMITKGQDHSLSVYLRDDFAELANRARAAAKNSVQARATARTLAANTDEQRLDSQGRITLPVEHRRYAGLTKECVVIGAVDHLEIWDADAWRRYQDEHEETYSQAGIESLDAIL